MILKLSLTICLVLGQVGAAAATSTSEILPTTSGLINLVSNVATVADTRRQKDPPSNAENIATTEKQIFLYIPVSTAAPDPIGIAKVSGWYGPGTWAAWFLTIMGAWLGIFRASEAKVDGNTWSYLIGTNWAAADLLRYVRLVSHGSTRSEQMLLLGSYAAAFNITFWGLFHAVWQLFWTCILFRKHKRAKQRGRTLLAGLVLPSIALLASGVQTTTHASMLDDLPALYCHAMDNFWHSYAITISAFSFVLLAPTGCFFGVLYGDDFFPVAPVRDLFEKIYDTFIFRSIMILYAFAFLLLSSVWIVVFLTLITSQPFYYEIIPFAPLAFFIWTIPLPLLWLTIYIIIVAYPVRGYPRGSVSITKSCFFMPCAPQSITDEDQLYPLLVGLLFLIGFDVGPVLYLWYKAWREARKERRAWRENLKRRIAGTNANEDIQLRGLRRRIAPGTAV